MAATIKDLGKVTAYAYAKAAGYTGTEEQFQAIFDEFTENAPGLIDRMDTAVARAEAAVTTIEATIQDAVDDAVEEATASAVATANQAVTDAQAAQTAAEGAVTQANNAVTQANAAVTAAQAAQSAAEDAAESFVLDRALTDPGAAAPADLVGDLKESFSRNTGDPLYTFIKSGYIKTDTGVGSTVNLTPVQATNYEYIIIDCSANDQFMYKAWGTTAARQYAFIDENNAIIEVAGEYAETTRYIPRSAPTNAAKLIINNRISKGEAGVYKTPTINERLNSVMLDDGAFLTETRNATSGSAFDGRSMFNYDPSNLKGEIVKIRYECDDSIFPDGLYWMSGNGKYLSGSAQLYKPNTDYYVAVGDSFATSGNKYSGLYGAAALVQGSGAVTAYFYTEFENSRGYLQYQINNWHGKVQNIVADMLCWGDSLTAGAGGDGTTYPAVCASELGISVRNCGVGGETGNTIAARQGGNSVVIPAGAINGTYSTLTDIYGTQIAPLLQGNGNGSGNKLYINGEECSLAYSNSVYTISGYTKGSSAVPLIGRFAGSSFHGKIVTIWCGANGARIGSDTSVTARIAIIDSMIRNIGHDHFVVFANWTNRGTEADFTDDDAAMLAHYGNKFFPVRKMLVDYGLTLMDITPTTQDETDIADGRIPTSLRSDSVHLNADGYTAVGKFLADKIRSLGYV